MRGTGATHCDEYSSGLTFGSPIRVTAIENPVWITFLDTDYVFSYPDLVFRASRKCGG